MHWCRIAFALLLILALLPALSAMPPKVSGQGYVTSTTQATTTVLYTYAATTSYVTETTSGYLGSQGSRPIEFDLSTCGSGALSKPYQKIEFNAIAAQSFHVNWTNFGTLPSDFYITTAFAKADNAGCNSEGTAPTFQFQALYHQKGVAGQGDWVAPEAGQFIAWMFNFSPGFVAGAWSIRTAVTTLVASYGNATESTTKLLILTSTIPQVGQVGLPFGSLGLLVAAAVAIVAGVLVVARRRKPSLAAKLKEEHPRATLKEERRIEEHPPRPAVIQVPRKDTVSPQPIVPAKTIVPPKVVQAPTIVSTGYADLDKALGGGIPEKFGVVIVSPSYDERDLLLRRVVNSALSSGKLAIFLSNDIGRTEDLTSRYPNGFYALSPQADRIIHGPNLLKIPSFENFNDANISLALALKDVIAKEKATKRIMIIDILSDLLLRHKSVLTRRWLTDFVGKRKAEGFTIIATLNPLTTTKEETQSIIDFFDGVIEIFEKPLAERTRRFLIIRKMYGQRYSDGEVLMDKDKLF
ncbi:MAG: ATPase domain-containing protein [Candidatus Bathyarchaeia archaeon]